MPQLRQLKEHLRPLPGFVGSGGVVRGSGVVRGGSGNRLLLDGALDHFQMEHDPRRNVGKILNLGTVVGLLLEGKVQPASTKAPPLPYHRKTVVLASRWPPGTNVLWR